MGSGIGLDPAARRPSFWGQHPRYRGRLLNERVDLDYLSCTRSGVAAFAPWNFAACAAGAAADAAGGGRGCGFGNALVLHEELRQGHGEAPSSDLLKRRLCRPTPARRWSGPRPPRLHTGGLCYGLKREDEVPLPPCPWGEVVDLLAQRHSGYRALEDAKRPGASQRRPSIEQSMQPRRDSVRFHDPQGLPEPGFRLQAHVAITQALLA
mmetsp:Transcript_33814/g.71849  ORF Transcript_33814/g.71849 Transcript_33814/m.71849 type:complete len:209 (-) Transcript_33814:217-843(-)